MNFIHELFIFNLILTYLFKNIVNFECQLQAGNICCDNSCIICGECSRNITIDNLCCSNSILDSGIYCNMTDIPPCIIPINFDSPIPNNNNDNNNETKVNEFILLIEWIKTAELWQLIIFFASTGGFLVCIFYACCCFGRKKPPIKYQYIVGKVGKNK